jgi:HSP90 family molecular chaperone
VEFCAWLKKTLGKTKVREVKTTFRLEDSPAIVTDHQSGALRRMMRMVVSILFFLLFLFFNFFIYY